MEMEKRQVIKAEIKGIVTGGVGLFLLLALASFDVRDSTFNSYSASAITNNLSGRLGANLADLFFQTLGVASYVVVVGLFFLAHRLFKFRSTGWGRREGICFAVFITSLSCLLALNGEFVSLMGQHVPAGGFVGYKIATFLKVYFGFPGTILALIVAMIASLMAIVHFSISQFVAGGGFAANSILARFRARQSSQIGEGASAAAMWLKQSNQVAEETLPSPANRVEPSVVPAVVVKPAMEQILGGEGLGDAEGIESGPKEDAAHTLEAEAAVEEDFSPRKVISKIIPFVAKRKQEEPSAPSPTESVSSAMKPFRVKDGFDLPDLSLLAEATVSSRKLDRDTLTANARLLEAKLKDFGIDGNVVEICPGPVITMYEFSPGPGVKVSRIAGLADDLSMALCAHSVRIIAPIPGKSVVGIELPNADREMVALKEIFSCHAFAAGNYKLPLALGKDISGDAVVADLAKMPHLLVAGATGSGKSVSINTMILSLLFKFSPRDVRMIMVDPKMLELSVYEGIPHLLLPVVTNPKKASVALKWAVREMERRYRLMADKGVRNIDSYNAVIARDGLSDAVLGLSGADGTLEHGHLPYIVVIVDELADLMMVVGREIEESIARLAQMARAAGIHLILATQRPSVDVITGLIKANFPARISFRVSSKIDSRTILDSNGAEALLGNGDMLMLPPGTAKMQRIHGAFVSDTEVQIVVDALKQQAPPQYDDSILESKGDEKNSVEDDEVDEYYRDAVAFAIENRQISISLVQRKFKIGYNRAARIVEKMEDDGYVGPSDGSGKAREVLAR